MAKAKATAAPVYTKTLGGPAAVSDIEVSLQAAAGVGVHRSARACGRQCGSAVRWPQDGTAAAVGRQAGRKTQDVALKADGTARKFFTFRTSKAGLYRYEVRAEALPGEVSTANNAAPLLLRVIDQPVRVLLLEGKPYWDTKFLVRTLSADPSIELTSVVRLSEGRLLQRKLPRAAIAETVSPRPLGEGQGVRANQGSSVKDQGSGLRDNKSQISNSKSEISNSKSPISNPQSSIPNPSSSAGESWTIEKDAGKFLSDADVAGHVSDCDPRPQRRGVFDRRRPGEAAKVDRRE